MYNHISHNLSQITNYTATCPYASFSSLKKFIFSLGISYHLSSATTRNNQTHKSEPVPHNGNPFVENADSKASLLHNGRECLC